MPEPTTITAEILKKGTGFPWRWHKRTFTIHLPSLVLMYTTLDGRDVKRGEKHVTGVVQKGKSRDNRFNLMFNPDAGTDLTLKKAGRSYRYEGDTDPRERTLKCSASGRIIRGHHGRAACQLKSQMEE